MRVLPSQLPAGRERAARHGRRRRPLITVAIPSYNRPALLRQALASVAAQWEFDDYEVVVCDDGALPETAAVVRATGLPNLRFHVNRPAAGPIGNWNRCIELATGDWVTILHEDDLLYPWFFRTVAMHLDRAAVAVAVRCVQGVTPPPVPVPSRDHSRTSYSPLWFLKSSMTPFPGVVFSRAIARRLGGFKPAAGGVADYTFWYELACAGRFDVIPTTAAFYRLNEGQWTAREWPDMLRRAHLLRLRIAREQFGPNSKAGRWLARFYTARMARSYARRFEGAPAILRRARRFEAIPLGAVPSGWVWAWLKWLSRHPTGEGTRVPETPAYPAPVS